MTKLYECTLQAIHQANNSSIKNARSSIKKQLKKDYIRNWLKARNNTSEGSREKFTHKEVKFDYQLEDYLKTIRNPAHRISMTKLRLGVHSLRIQTGKYENRGAPIPVDGRTCLVCNRGYIEVAQGTITLEMSSILSFQHTMLFLKALMMRVRYVIYLP